MIFINRRRICVFTIACFSSICLLTEVEAGGMMERGGMLGGKKGSGGNSAVEAMLVAGILAKLLGNNNEKSHGSSHPMYVPMPMFYHTMSGGHGMGGGYGMGGYGMGGHGMSW
ncbi:hypothetical protein NPIL_80161 [Nephila pilipes]|uniref:Uncharacterized protein n=1 Tax=Nephila pilipes TaxID=299642 RepID=A0A8X6UBA1_NEPPI|nr:hypothetical protein NPIL_80161 [Nephila pilipes]